MKYNININQKALTELAPDLDIADAAILDYVGVLCNSKSGEIVKMRLKYRNNDYTWLDYSSLIEQMPLLKLKPKSLYTISKRITLLEKNGFIQRYRLGNQKLFVRLLERYDLLYMDKPLITGELNKNLHSSKYKLNKNLHGAKQKDVQSQTKSCTYNYTSDNYTKIIYNTLPASESLQKKESAQNLENQPSVSPEVLHDFREEDKQLALKLNTLILKNYPFVKKTTNIQRDHDAINKLNRIDERSYPLINQVIEWSQKDPFWRKNIRSATTLREKFDTILIRMVEERKKGATR